MATPEQIGKRWYIRLTNGELLIKTSTGKLRYFSTQEMAEFTAGIITEREQNPRLPSWRAAVEEARRKTHLDSDD